MLLERPCPDWTIARLLALIRDRTTDLSQLTKVVALPLPDSWHRLFQTRLISGVAESWSKRPGPPLAGCRVPDEYLVHTRRPLLMGREVLKAALAEWNEAEKC